jgi:hypothetical protein
MEEHQAEEPGEKEFQTEGTARGKALGQEEQVRFEKTGR